MEAYSASGTGTTPSSVPPEARGRWRLYPIWPVDEKGVCACPKREKCGHPGKHPAISGGVHGASSEPLEIAEMFAARPGCNVGLATGVRSGAVVLDHDSYAGASGSLKALQEEYGRLPPTRLHQTGSTDLHWLFAVPAGLERLPSRTIAPGIELKADGAGVVLPPSVTNWGQYEVLIEGPLAPLPGWIVEMATSLTVHEGGGDRGTESRYRLPEIIREGTRAWTLYRYGCALRAGGHEPAAILEELLGVNKERCRPPLPLPEVEGRARSAARHEAGNASTVTPEALAALADVEAAVLRSPWPEPAGGSEYGVLVALILAARRHGSLIPSGVRISLDFRSLALAAGMGKSTANRAAHRLRLKGWLRFDNHGRNAEHSGAFVLLVPTPRTLGHSTTPLPPPSGPGSSRATKTVSVPLRAPRLRRGGSLGKTAERALDALEGAGGEMTSGALARALGVKRIRDLRRRSIVRLEAARAVEVEQTEGKDYTVRLTDGWLEALDRERTMSGEKKAENLDRAEHERQREAFRLHLAERKREERG